jgi:hypothetical protein
MISACLSTSYLFYASKREPYLMWSLSHSEVLYDLKHIGQTWKQRMLLDYQVYLWKGTVSRDNILNIQKTKSVLSVQSGSCRFGSGYALVTRIQNRVHCRAAMKLEIMNPLFFIFTRILIPTFSKVFLYLQYVSTVCLRKYKDNKNLLDTVSSKIKNNIDILEREKAEMKNVFSAWRFGIRIEVNCDPDPH